MNSIISIGVDEAGYGPLLGPLVVCAYATHQQFDSEIKDSKKIYKNKNLNKLIERCQFYYPNFTVQENMNFSESLQNEPWLKSIHSSEKDYHSHFFSDENTSVCTTSIYTEAFNSMITEGNNKAQIEIKLIFQAIKDLILKSNFSTKKINLRIDRLGGRKNYQKVLEGWGAKIKTFSEENHLSEYEVDFLNHEMTVSFVVKGDTHHHVIASASCFAKLQRELAMKTFNEWWINKLPLLKGTAGYYTDGKRFIKDIELYLQEHNIPLFKLERNL